MSSSSFVSKLRNLLITIDQLGEDVPSQKINDFLMDVEIGLSYINDLDPKEQNKYFTLLLKAKERLLSLGRRISVNTEISMTIDPGKLELGEVIGEGTFGVVRRAKLAGSLVAVKIMQRKDDEATNRILAEATLTSKINCANVVRFLGVAISGDNIYIVSELCDDDLSTFCRNKRGEDPHAFVTNAVKWFCQAARGLAWMHEVWFMIHHDVKPANILLKNGNAMVADFGLSKCLKSQRSLFCSTAGSPYYKAPEILNGKPFGLSVDVYAFGVTMYEVLLGDYPYSRSIRNEEQLRRALNAGKRPSDYRSLPVECPASLLNLIKRCWDADPDKRPKMMDVCEQLKAIYIETLISVRNAAFDFWLKSFSDDITDSAPLSRGLAAMPGAGDNKIEEMRRYLLGVPASVPTDYCVRLKDLHNLVCWYGDWFDPNVLKTVVSNLKKHKYLVGFIERNEAESIVQKVFLETKKGCFLVRCSKTDPVKSPFTITVYDDGVANYRIVRGVDHGTVTFSCPNLGTPGSPVIQKQSVFDLITELVNEGVLKGEPFTGVFSKDVY